MAEITSAAVKALREKTGAGMMDCKKALTEAGATRSRPSKSCASAGLRPPARRRAASRPRASSAPTSTWAARSACSSRSTARPTFVPRAPRSSSSCQGHRDARRRGRPRYSRARSCRPTCSTGARDHARAVANDRRTRTSPSRSSRKIVEGRLGKFYEERCCRPAVVKTRQDHQRALLTERSPPPASASPSAASPLYKMARTRQARRRLRREGRRARGRQPVKAGQVRVTSDR